MYWGGGARGPKRADAERLCRVGLQEAKGRADADQLRHVRVEGNGNVCAESVHCILTFHRLQIMWEAWGDDPIIFL